MKLLLDADGKVVVRNDKPVYVADDGKEVEFDAPGTVATIGRLNKEAQTFREKAEAHAGVIKAFEGLEPAAARKALDIVKNLDDKKLVDAGEVEKVKTEAIRASEDKYKPVVEENAKLKAEIFGEKVGGAFARSKFIADKIAVPADFVEARFGNRFKVEEGKVVGYDANGQKIFSHSRPGEIADFDEALETMVNGYADKARILKGSGANGGGASGSARGAGGKATLTRAEFDKMNSTDRAAKMAAVNKGELSLVDG